LKTILKAVDRSYEDGKIALTRIPRFHFYWSLDHFRHDPDMFGHSYIGLSERNKTSYARIIEFVHSFSPSRVVDILGIAI